MYLSNTAPKYAIVSAQGTTSKEVVVINLDVPIDEGSGSMLSRAFARAQADHAAAVIIDMNTPGGLLEWSSYFLVRSTIFSFKFSRFS